MTIIEEEPVYPGGIATSGYLAWTPAVAGALIATALSAVLIAFGAAVGLGVASAAPTWRDASVALWLLSGVFLILVALVSFGFGGYVAGRIRTGRSAADATDLEHRDGAHGLAAWAIAVVLTVLVTALVGSATMARTPLARSAPAASAAEPLLSYELDRLFRPARRTPNAETAMERAEAGRILLDLLQPQWRCDRGPRLPGAAGGRHHRAGRCGRGTSRGQYHRQCQNRDCAFPAQRHHCSILDCGVDPAWSRRGLVCSRRRRPPARRRRRAGGPVVRSPRENNPSPDTRSILRKLWS